MGVEGWGEEEGGEEGWQIESRIVIAGYFRLVWGRFGEFTGWEAGLILDTRVLGGKFT